MSRDQRQASDRDRFYVQRDRWPYFQRLSQGEEAPFRTMKDVWVLAASMGFKAQRRTPMTGGTQHVGFWHYLSTQEDIPLLQAIAIAETGDVEVLAHRDDVIKIAEEYANGGIDLLLESERPDADGTVRSLAAAVVEAEPKLETLSSPEAPPALGNRSVLDLIRDGEGATIEFKQTARWSVEAGRQDPEVELAAVKTVAAFLNSKGGTLLVGVTDAGRPVGLHDDYKLLGKRQDRDGWANWFTGLLDKRMGKPPLAHCDINFDAVDGVEIARVDVDPSPQPVYVDGKIFFARFSNNTRELNTPETIDYISRHWNP